MPRVLELPVPLDQYGNVGFESITVRCGVDPAPGVQRKERRVSKICRTSVSDVISALKVASKFDQHFAEEVVERDLPPAWVICLVSRGHYT